MKKVFTCCRARLPRSPDFLQHDPGINTGCKLATQTKHSRRGCALPGGTPPEIRGWNARLVFTLKQNNLY